MIRHELARDLAHGPADRRAPFPDARWWGRRLPLIAGVLTPILICGLAVLLYQLVDTSNRLRAAERHSQERRALILQVLSSHQDVETGQRGYIITGRESFLEPFEGGTAGLEATFAELTAMSRGDAEAMQRIATLESLSRRKIVFSQATIDLKRAGNGAQADRLVGDGHGKALMDAIRVQIAAMMEDEDARLASTTRQSTHALLVARVIIFGLLGVLMLLLGAAAAAIWHTARARQRVIRALDDASRRSAALLDSAMDGIVTFLPDGRMEGMNRAATRMFGLTEAEAAGRNIGTLYAEPPAEDYARRELADMALKPGEGVVRHGRARHTGGHTFPVDVAITLAVLAGGARYMAVVRDVSEREKIERMKSEFTATVSHELRTPLASVSASLGLILGGAAGEIGERARHLVTLAHRNSERLVRLVNDILDIERLAAGRMEFEIASQPLAPILTRAIRDVAPWAEKQGVRIDTRLDETVTVAVDEDRLLQVATNLLSNAIKFSPQGGTVTVMAEDGPGFSVCDDGPGVPEEHRLSIFERFAQVDASDSREKGGTGLGLAIVRDMLSCMDGAIVYEDRDDMGACFRVTLKAGEEV